jgi:KaiC/GvpD/RAD55 family RecA-like ATPase
MSDKPTWHEEIERGVVALFIQDAGFASCVIDELNPSHLAPANAVIYGAVRDYYKKYGVMPTDVALYDSLRVVLGPKDAQFLRPTIVTMFREVSDVDYIKARALEFINIRNLETSLARASEHLISGSYEEARGSMLAFREVGPRRVIDYFDDTVPVEEAEAIPTGILELDHYLLGGGIQRGREGIILAGTGVGKSTLSLNFGAHGVRVGYRCLHITGEDSRAAVKRRYDCRFTGRAIKFGTKLTEQDHRMIDTAKINGGDLQIREVISGKFSSSSVRMAIQSEPYMPDIVIVDYLDIMRPDTRREDKRFEHEDIANELRGIAQEFMVDMWVNKQADRAARHSEKVGSENMAESYGPARIADVVLGLARPPQEKQRGRILINLDKQRDGIDGRTIQCIDDRPRMLIRGVVTAEELSEEQAAYRSAHPLRSEREVQ